MTSFGMLYESGAGVTQDYGKAREQYEKAAAQGSAKAMNNLGSLYAQGKAREWYEKAAAKGVVRAMDNLGFLYATGQGVAKDPAKAREWYKKAADKGDDDA
jgi:TPR repeat protein